MQESKKEESKQFKSVVDAGKLLYSEIRKVSKPNLNGHHQVRDQDIRLQALGGATSKFKILITYTQCMTFLPVVFEVPWPDTLKRFMKMLEFTSLDIFTFFGEVSCHVSDPLDFVLNSAILSNQDIPFRCDQVLHRNLFFTCCFSPP